MEYRRESEASRHIQVGLNERLNKTLTITIDQSEEK
jgi:hypothetical protein